MQPAGASKCCGPSIEKAREPAAALCVGEQGEKLPDVRCRPAPVSPASRPGVGAEAGAWKGTPSTSEAAARFFRVRRGLPWHIGGAGAESLARGTAAPAAGLAFLGGRDLAAVRTTLTVLRVRCARNVPLKEDGSVRLLVNVPAQPSEASASLESPETKGLHSRWPVPTCLTAGDPSWLDSWVSAGVPATLLWHAAAANAAHSASSYVAELCCLVHASSKVPVGVRQPENWALSLALLPWSGGAESVACGNNCACSMLELSNAATSLLPGSSFPLMASAEARTGAKCVFTYTSQASCSAMQHTCHELLHKLLSHKEAGGNKPLSLQNGEAAWDGTSLHRPGYRVTTGSNCRHLCNC